MPLHLHCHFSDLWLVSWRSWFFYQYRRGASSHSKWNVFCCSFCYIDVAVIQMCCQDRDEEMSFFKMWKLVIMSGRKEERKSGQEGEKMRGPVVFPLFCWTMQVIRCSCQSICSTFLSLYHPSFFFKTYWLLFSFIKQSPPLFDLHPALCRRKAQLMLCSLSSLQAAALWLWGKKKKKGKKKGI